MFAAMPDAALQLTLRLVDVAGTPTLQLLSKTGTLVASKALVGTSLVEILGSDLDDFLTVDLTRWFSVPIEFHGRSQSPGGADALRVVGDGSNAASYLPNGLVGGDGEIVVDGTTITFTGLEPVTISDMAKLTVVTPGSEDELTIDSPDPGQSRISGTSDGVAFEEVTFLNIPDVTVDAATNGTPTARDTVTIRNGLVASRLQNFAVWTGPGADTLILETEELSLPEAGGIFAFSAGAAVDTVRGPPADAIWHIHATDQGSIGALMFTGVEYVIGGDGDDVFVFAPGGSFRGGIDGGPGNDSLVGPDIENTWVINGPNGGTLNDQTFADIENLIGGEDADRFVFLAGGSISGRIDGRGGSNTFDYSALADGIAVNLTGGTATGAGTIANLTELVGGTGQDTLIGPREDVTWTLTGLDTGSVGVVSFAGVENLTGGAGTDTFVVTSSADLSGVLDGGSGIDALVGPDRASTWEITGTDAGALNSLPFLDIEDLFGGVLDDVFIFALFGSLSGRIAGGWGIDRVRGADKRNRWVITGSSSATLNGVSLDGVEQLQGGSRDDEFVFAYDANAPGFEEEAGVGLFALSSAPQLNDVIDNQLADFLDPALFPDGIPSTDFVLLLSTPARISDLLELADPTLRFRDLVYVNSAATAWAGFVDVTALAAKLFPDDAAKRSTIGDAPEGEDLTAMATGVPDDSFAVTGRINLDEQPRTSDLEQDLLFLDTFVTPVIGGRVDLDSSGAIDGNDDGTLGTRLGAVPVVDGILQLPDPALTFLAFGLVGPVGGGLAVLRLLTVHVVAGSLDINGNGVVDASDNGVLAGANGAARGLENGLGWPGWIKVEPTFQKLFWTNFRNDASYIKPRLTTDADLDLLFTGNELADAILSKFFQFGGRVTGLVFDLGLRRDGKFPVVEIGSVSANIAVTIFGFVDIQGAFTLGLVKVDAGGNLTEIESQVADRVLYGAVRARAFISKLPGQKAPAPNPDGSPAPSGDKGFGFALGLSEFGPLQVFIESPIPFLLEPTTTLSIKGLRGGVTFGSTLPDITDPEDLRGPAFKPASDLTLAEWDDRLKEAVANQAKAAAEARLRGEDFAALWVAFTEPMRIEAGGELFFKVIPGKIINAQVDIIIDTEGRILIKGVLNALVVIKVPTWLYLNFSDVDLTNPDAISVTLLALFDFPEIPQAVTDAIGLKPLLTGRGSLIFQPLKDGLPLDIDPVEVTDAFSAPAVGGGFQVTFEVDPTRIDEFQPGTRIVVRDAVPGTYNGEFVVTAVDQRASTITLRVGAAVIDGELDTNFDGVIDASDDGTVPGVGAVIGGRVDVNGDGVVDGADDRHSLADWLRRLLGLPVFASFAIIDGRRDSNGDGVIDAADDDPVGIGDPGDYVGGARITRADDEPDAFELELTGGVDFNIPFVTTLTLDGHATMTFTIDPAQPRIDFGFDAALSETTVGNIGRAVGALHLVFDMQGSLVDVAAGGGSAILAGLAGLIGGLLADTATPPPLATATDPGDDPEAEIAPARPILILPGIGGSFAADGFREQWFTQRGVHAANLQIDPLGQYYHDLVRTLRDVDYTLDQDLFVANYDWRMNPGPVDPALLDSDLTNDVFDGFIAGLTAASITDDEFLYGVDYLGYWLALASERWAANHGVRPSSVDVIAHSTGGLVARSYIQSAAYGGTTLAGYVLPLINDLIMVGVPNRGASKAWNVLHNDWDVELSFRIVLSKAISEAYSRLTNPADPDYTGIITGPDYDILHHAGIPDPNPANTNVINPSAVDFIKLYVPTGRSLLATYAFLDPDGSGPQSFQTVNDQVSGTGARNAFLLDLNAGLDVDFDLAALDASPNHTVVVGGVTKAPNAFIDFLAGSAVIIYADGIQTPVHVIQHTGPATLASGEASGREILPFTSFIGRNPGPAEIWYEDVRHAQGDSTVPSISAVGQFASDDLRLASDKLQIHRFTSADVDASRPTTLKGIIQKGDLLDHTGLMSLTAAQRTILTTLGLVEGVDFRVGVPPASNDVSFGLWNNPLQALVRAVFLGILEPDDLHQLLAEQLPLPTVEVWGAATLDTNFGFLRPVGIFGTAQGVLRLNTTTETKFEVLPQLTEFHLGATDVTVFDTGSGFEVTVALGAGAAQFDIGDLIVVRNPDNRLFNGAFTVSAVDTGAGTITYLMDSDPGAWVGTRGSLSPAREVELPPEEFALRVDGSLEFRIDFDGDGFNPSEVEERVFLIAGAFAMRFGRQGFDVAVFREDPTSPTGLGPATLQIGPEGAAFLQFDVFGFLAIRNDTTFDQPGGDGINNSGFAASLVVALDVTLPGALAEVVDINGQFVVVINTTFSEISFTIPPGADGRTESSDLTVTIPRGPPDSVTDIDLVKVLAGDATAFGNPAALAPAAYVLVYIGGTDPSTNPDAVFKVAFFELTGKFSLLARFDTRFFLDIEGDFSLDITAGTLTLLRFDGQGFLRFDETGLLTALNLSLAAGVPTSFGFTLTASFRLELNSTGQPRSVPGFGNIAPGFRIHADGELRLAGGAFVLEGTFDLEVDSTGVSMQAHSSVSIFGFPFTADGLLAIRGDPDPGIVFSIVLTVGNSSSTTIAAVPGLINITGRFLLQVNTTKAAFGGVPVGLRVAVSDAAGTGPATVNVLGFIMTGGVTISITPAGFEIRNLDLSLNFFNFVTFRVTGNLFANGAFNLTAGFNISVGNSTFGASGSASATFSNAGFSASGSFSGRLFGFNVGPISGSFSLSNNRVSLSIRVQFSTPALRVCGFLGCVTIIPAINFDRTATFFIGTVSPPTAVAPPATAPPAPVLARKVGTDLFLNIGVDAHLRGAASGTTGETFEVFEVTHVSGVSDNETLAVSAFNVTQQFSGIARIIVTDAGEDDDAITVAVGVLADADLNGGDDDDELIYSGAGDAILRGGNGRDRLTGGSGANILEGGEGDDLLEGGPGTNVVRGGPGNDQIEVRAGVYDVFGDGGDDVIIWHIDRGGQLNSLDGGADLNHPANPFRDTLRIIGTDAAETAVVTSAPPGFTVAYTGFTAAAVNTEGLVLDVRGGGDTVTINDPTASSLAQVAMQLGSDGAPDNVTLHGSPLADVFNLMVRQDDEGADFVAIENSIGFAIEHSHAASGDSLTIRGNGGADLIDAHSLDVFLISLILEGNDGPDRIIGSPFSDILDGGRGKDTITGGLGVDVFRGFAGLTDADRDALIEELDVDFALTDDTLTVSRATLPAEVEQLTDAFGNQLFDLVVLRGGPGDNAFAVSQWTGNATLDGTNGSDAYTIDLNGAGSSLITIDDTGTSGTDTVVVNGTDGADVFTLTGDVLRLGIATETLNYSSLEEFTLNSLGGDDEITIFQTHAGLVTVNTGDGDDTVALLAVSGPTTINTGAGTDVIDVRGLGLGAPLTVEDPDGTNLSLDFSQASAGLDLTLTSLGLSGPSLPFGISYAGVGTLTITLGPGADMFNVRGVGASSLVLHTGDGGDTVNVGSTAPDPGGTVDDIDALLLLGGGAEGPGGSLDQLNVDDSGDLDADSGVLSAVALLGLGMASGIRYTGFEDLTIGLGSGGDTLAVESTHSGTTRINTNAGADTVNVQTIAGATTIDTGPGADTVNVGSLAPESGGAVDGIAALLSIRGGTESSTDQLNVDDRGDIVPNEAVLTGSSLTGLGMASGIDYSGFEVLTIGLGSGGDVFNVRGTSATTTLFMNGGDDKIFVSSLADESLGTAATADFLRGHLDAIHGALHIDAGTGRHRLMVSDEAATVGDPAVVLSSALISGLAPAAITYDTHASDGNFADGITVWSGSGGDTIEVASTHRRDGVRTITTLNTGDGDDDVTVSLNALTDGFFVLNTQGDDDTVDGSGSSLPLVIFGGAGSDDVTGGAGGDIIFGDHGRVEYLDQDDVVTRLGGGGPGDVTDGVDRPLGRIFTVDPLVGGDDTIFGGDGDDLILAGNGTSDDVVDAGDGDNIVFGDHGRVVFADGALVLIESTDPQYGDADVITTGTGNDIVLGGRGGDTISSGAGNDLVFGDHGMVAGNVDASLLPLSMPTKPFVFLAVFTQHTDDAGYALGGDDMIFAAAGEDIVLGQQGSDTIYGGDGDDDIIGGHNVPGGHDGDDWLDGGSGADVIAGDNASILRRGDSLSPRMRVLLGQVVYDSQGLVNVAAGAQADPKGTAARDIVLFDHSHAVQEDASAQSFGNDYIAGGPGDDMLFGQLGDDVIQGDGSIGGALAGNNSVGAYRTPGGPGDPIGPLAVVPSFEAETDGDDYIEGGGGNDVIFGGLGQDDIIGGSSSLFGLTEAWQRPDGSDMIFGGAGIRINRNEFIDSDFGLRGTTDILFADRHARDADAIVGDNGNIYRLVGVNGQVGNNNSGVAIADGFLAFNYDLSDPSRGSLRIIARGVTLLDYTAGGPDFRPDLIDPNTREFPDIGGADEVHGESGDDTVYGGRANDVLFGDSEDDDLIGGWGRDWISGGTGQDGVIGDDGRILTSRNHDGSGEPLYGVLAIPAGQPDLEISTPGNLQEAVINRKNALKKTVDITPFNLRPDADGADDPLFDPMHADDVIYGGLGSDFLHGASGDDAISGAEALPESYGQLVDAGGNVVGVVRTDFDHPYNAGNMLRFNPDDPDGWRSDQTRRAGEFALYDEFDPRRKVQLKPDGGLYKGEGGITPLEFFLNFDHTEGAVVSDPTWGEAHSDGDDALFGDPGNDWIVGGTGRDNMYGGWGNDLLNADDVLASESDPEGLNDGTDTHPTHADRAFGGAGRDVLIANTGGDRLIDWVGQFNSYIVPFAPFGAFTISRTVMPQLFQFLYDLSESDGADPTRAADTGNDPARNGEPDGELGLVTQRDPAWQDQTGGPTDPQPGNIPGGPRDVLRSADFNDASMQRFSPDSGVWEVNSGALYVTAESVGLDAVSVFHVDHYLPGYYEIVADVMFQKPLAGWKANAYVIFDYFGAADFKYAGINQATNKIEVGRRAPQGWIMDAYMPMKLWPDIRYHMLVAVHGTTVTVQVNGAKAFTHTFAARVIDGYSYGLNTGMVGVGSDNARGIFDNIAVRVLPPAITLDHTEDFEDGVANLFTGPTSGIWRVPGGGWYVGAPESGESLAVNLIDLGIGQGLQAGSYLELQAILSTSTMAGLVFDQYAFDDFKFVVIDVQSGQILIGHHSPRKGWTIDNATPWSLTAGAKYALTVSLRGASAAVRIAGQTVPGWGFSASVVDGGFGLLTLEGPSSVDQVRVMTNDPVFGAADAALTAAGTAEAPAGIPATLTESDLRPVVDEAMRRWSEVLGVARESVVPGDALRVAIAGLPEFRLGQVHGNTVLIDDDGAGYGWFVEHAPADTGETDLGGRMDLLTVVMHELGHVLGLDHHDADEHSHDLMEATLPDGLRLFAADSRTAPTGGAAYGTAADGPAPHVSVSSVNRASEVNGRPFEWSGQGYASARLSWQFRPDLPEFVNWSRQAQSYARSFVSFGHSLLFWQENDDVTPRDTPRHAGNLGSAE